MENVHEELEKYECNKCGKCFTQNIGLKTHISAVHEKKKSIVIYVANILIEDVISKYTYKLFMKKTLNSNVMNVTRILLKHSM